MQIIDLSTLCTVSGGYDFRRNLKAAGWGALGSGAVAGALCTSGGPGFMIIGAGVGALGGGAIAGVADFANQMTAKK